MTSAPVGFVRVTSGDLGNGIYASISNEGSDTPVTRPETDKAGQSPRDRKRGGRNFKFY